MTPSWHQLAREEIDREDDHKAWLSSLQDQWWFPQADPGGEKKYDVWWDNLGDAYEEYEALADAFLRLLASADKET